MSELNREDIEKSVDYLNNVLLNWDLWQTHHRRLTQAVGEVLALIKSQEERIKELAEERANTIREMQKRLTNFFEADDFVRYNEVDADYINEQIDKIANKLLEEKQ